MYTSKVHLLHIRRNERTPASVTSLCKAKKAPVLRQAPLLLVRVTGLEPARQGHQNLNLARLPFRHTRMNGYASSIPVQSRFVNRPRGRAQPDVVGLQYMLDK